jgi:NAD(P)-dependent dehydrogenase (short-subunit alcohol dehydrogenase family)
MATSVAVVTGAAGDIGRAIARALAGDHEAVVLADIDASAAAAAAADLSDGRIRFEPFACDITDPQSTEALAAFASGLGSVATLVNNAGAARDISLQSTTGDNWRRDMALNLDGCFHCFKAFENALKQSQGSVVNIASVNGLAVFGHPAYSAAKAGMIHLTRLIAVEYGKFGIRANAVAPGTVRTQAWEARAAANPNVFEEARRWYPLQRVVPPEDVASAVRFLAGASARSITGVCLPVDCGLTAGQAELAATFSQSADY